MYNGATVPSITLWGTAPYGMKGSIGGGRCVIGGACKPLAKGKATGAIEGLAQACDINCDRQNRKCGWDIDSKLGGMRVWECGLGKLEKLMVSAAGWIGSALPFPLHLECIFFM